MEELKKYNLGTEVFVYNPERKKIYKGKVYTVFTTYTETLLEGADAVIHEYIVEFFDGVHVVHINISDKYMAETSEELEHLIPAKK